MPAEFGSRTKTRKYHVGDVIADKYRLMKTLGEGGMGEVWEAQNTRLDAPVAIKLIRSELDDPSASERLVQEARAAARLGHPAIVRVFDVGETRFKDPFIVMERLSGSSLGDMLERQGRLAAASAVQVVLPIADALATAHLKGIVHRDIKPENIFIAEDETGELQPKLLDFGVVKFENADGSKLTEMGKVVGSPDYLSPEQARGAEDVDYRGDIWAFSVVLYELVTGTCPFKGANYNALLRSIVEDDPLPTTDHAAGDSELWSAIERGLRKNRDERWPSMLEFGRALAQWALSHGVDEDVCGTGLELKWLGAGSSQGRKSSESIHFDDTEAPSAIRAGLGRRSRDSSRAGRRSQPLVSVPNPAPPAEKTGYVKVVPWFAAGLGVAGAVWAVTALWQSDRAVESASEVTSTPPIPDAEPPQSSPARLRPGALPAAKKPSGHSESQPSVPPRVAAASSVGVGPVEATRPKPAKRSKTPVETAAKPSPKPKPTAKSLDKLDLKSPY